MAFSLRPTALFLLGLACAAAAQPGGLSLDDSLSSAQLLRVEQAFQPQALIEDGRVQMVWHIAPDYYLYRNQFRVHAGDREIESFQLPEGMLAYDPFFDQELEIYRGEVVLEFAASGTENLVVRFQGCADAGYCYPPSWAAFAGQPNSAALVYSGLVSGPEATLPAQQQTSRWMRWGVLVGALALLGVAVLILLPRIGDRKAGPPRN